MPDSPAHSILSLGLTEVQPVAPSDGATTTQRLTKRLQDGDGEAFREFHQLYFDRLYHFLLVLTHGHEEEARDVLQETLLRVVRYVRVFPSEEVFWCWLKALARSAARDQARKQHRYLALLQWLARHHRLMEEEPPSAEGQLESLLAESLEELASDDRCLLEGKYFAGESVKQLSLQRGLTEKAVESRLSRLRQGLRRRILQKLRQP